MRETASTTFLLKKEIPLPEEINQTDVTNGRVDKISIRYVIEELTTHS